MASWSIYSGGMEQSDQSYSLDELALESGFDRRVIRSFIEQGLLRGPDSMGRYARYSQAHLERLLAIKALKNLRGLPLHEVRRQLLSMTGQDIKSLAAATGTVRANVPPEASALDYLRMLPRSAKTIREDVLAESEDDEPVAQSHHHEEWQSAPSVLTTPADRLVMELGKLLESRRVRRQAKAESWHRISVTPDIELSVRGVEDSEELARIERIADYLREILLGGLENG